MGVEDVRQNLKNFPGDAHGIWEDNNLWHLTAMNDEQLWTDEESIHVKCTCNDMIWWAKIISW